MTLDAFRTEAISSISAAADPNALETVRVALLGKKGALTERLKSLGSATPEERKTLGAALNALKDELTAAIDARAVTLGNAALEAQLKTERLDVTLPARPRMEGRLHPISQTLDEMVSIFARMGFAVEEGPEIEDDAHNFTALNFPEFHPARQMHDTFFLNATAETGTPYLLRTHTSPIQIRTMRNSKPPFRFIAHGATYRCDSDQTHTPMFHQLECVVIEPGIHMGHLKGCIADFLKAFFEIPEVPLRFRPSFFPFTEPSAEVDIGCKRGKNTLEIGAGQDWLEVLGCGMVHPNVLKNCGLDPNEWQGFAFGMGVERLAMLKYGIPDLRTFFESDPRWLAHYGFDPLEPLGLRG